MNYLELIRKFWDFNYKNQIGSTGISMYMYLLKIGDDNNGYNFHISDVVASKELGLTRKTVKSTKEKLGNLGLIEFQTKNGFPCYYRLLSKYPLQIAELEKKEKIKSKISSNLENVEIQSQLRPLKPIVTHKNVPSLKEFIRYAKTLATYDAELDFEVKEKYQAWVHNGWRNNSDRPITNWKSSLKSILPYMKNSNMDHQLSIANIPCIKLPKI
jgi:replication initiation and membrane attachment protein DnaB